MSDDNRKPLEKGSILNFYFGNSATTSSIRIEEVVGFGGSCIVYRGNFLRKFGNEDLAASVIVKEFYPMDESDPLKRDADQMILIPDEFKEKFLHRKERFCAGLSKGCEFYEIDQNHSAARPFSLQEANNTIYAVTDPDAATVLRDIDRSKLTLNQIINIIISISSAIKSFHDHGYLYLDCKPDNIFFYHYQDEGTDIARLFDFDTVVHKDEIKNSRYSTYSLGWAAPEQHPWNPSEIGFSTDIYAIGAVLFWLLTGKKPDRTNIQDIERKRFSWKVYSPLFAKEIFASKEIQETLNEIMRNSLKQGAASRYQSIDELIQVLAHLRSLSMTDQTLHGGQVEIKKTLEEKSEEIKEHITRNEDTINSRFDAITDSNEKSFVGIRKALKKVAIILASVVILVGVAIGIFVASKTENLSNNRGFLSGDIPGHLILSLENANHQYEVGLENWRRLDYNRAERDILAARNEISASISQADTDVAAINNSLGCLYLDMGRYQEAYEYLNHAHTTFMSKYGDDAPETLASLFAIAQYDYYIGDISTAQKTIQTIIDTVGEDGDAAILSPVLHFSAQIYEDLGMFDDAISTYTNVLDLYNEVIQDGKLTNEFANYANDPKLTKTEKDSYTTTLKWISLTYNNLGEAYIHAGMFDQAESSIQVGLNLCLNNIYIGTKNLTTSKLYMNLAELFLYKDEVKKGIDTIDLAMRIQRNMFDFESVYPGLIEVYAIYGNLLYRKGDESLSADYFNDAVELSLASFGENHPSTAEALYARGVFFYNIGDYKMAAKDLETSIEIKRNILGYQQPTTAKYLYHLALSQIKLGEDNKALQSISDARDICNLLSVSGELSEQVNALFHKLEQ